MHRLIDETPVSAVVMISGIGALQMFIKWASPVLQFIILLGSALLIMWKVYLAFEQLVRKIKNRKKKNADK